MGADNDLVVISRDRDRLKDFSDYLNLLDDRSRDYDWDHEEPKVLTYAMRIYSVGDDHVLCGCLRKCHLHNVGRWAHKEGKEYLLEGCRFFENSEDSDEVIEFKVNKSEEDYLIGDYDSRCKLDAFTIEEVSAGVLSLIREFLSCGMVDGIYYADNNSGVYNDDTG